VFKPAVDVSFALEPKPGAAVERYVPATRRVRTELGVEQQVQLPEAVLRTIRYYTERSVS
jgi:isopentenyldiphosphate isomerase